MTLKSVRYNVNNRVRYNRVILDLVHMCTVCKMYYFIMEDWKYCRCTRIAVALTALVQQVSFSEGSYEAVFFPLRGRTCDRNATHSAADNQKLNYIQLLTATTSNVAEKNVLSWKNKSFQPLSCFWIFTLDLLFFGCLSVLNLKTIWNEFLFLFPHDFVLYTFLFIFCRFIQTIDIQTWANDHLLSTTTILRPHF